MLHTSRFAAMILMWVPFSSPLPTKKIAGTGQPKSEGHLTQNRDADAPNLEEDLFCCYALVPRDSVSCLNEMQAETAPLQGEEEFRFVRPLTRPKAASTPPWLVDMVRGCADALSAGQVWDGRRGSGAKRDETEGPREREVPPGHQLHRNAGAPIQPGPKPCPALICTPSTPTPETAMFSLPVADPAHHVNVPTTLQPHRRVLAAARWIADRGPAAACGVWGGGGAQHRGRRRAALQFREGAEALVDGCGASGGWLRERVCVQATGLGVGQSSPQPPTLHRLRLATALRRLALPHSG